MVCIKTTDEKGVYVAASWEDWKERFKDVHGDKYDYSNTKFVRSSEKITVICPEHGEWTTDVFNHSAGKGCPRCAIERNANKSRKTLEDFVSVATERWNGRYDYSKFVYTQARAKGIVICKEHGEFLVSPDNHKRGKGCPSCGKERAAKLRSITENDFVTLLNEKTQSVCLIGQYLGYGKKTEFNCDKHGVFLAAPNSVLALVKCCPSCGTELGVESRKRGLESCIEKSKEVHQGKYDYSMITGFDLVTDKYDILCKEHGVFRQTMHSHMSGSGCPVCAKASGYSSEKEGSLYFLKNSGCFKVGITNKEVSVRVSAINEHHTDKFKVAVVYSGSGKVCRDVEAALIREFSLSHDRPFFAPVDGFTEIFTTIDESAELELFRNEAEKAGLSLTVKEK